MEVASTVEDPPSVVKFTWPIHKFTKLNTKKLYSKIFVADGYKWRILIYPKGNNVDHLSMFLDVADSATLPYGWSRYAQFSLAVLNQICHESAIRKDTEHQFNANESDWGFKSFMPLSDLSDPSGGYLVNDTVVVEAEVVVHKKQDQEKNDVPTTVDEEDDTTIAPSPVLSSSAPMATSAISSTQGLTGSTTQLALTPQSIDKFISLSQPTDERITARTISLPEKKDIETVSLDDIDAFFQSLSSDTPASSASSVPEVSASPISTSQVSKPSKEEIEEALKQIKEALQMPPVRFDYPGRISPIEKALQTLSDLDESSGITISQKADILSLTEKFKTLPACANKAIKAKDNLAQKQTLKTMLDQNLKRSIAHFTVKKAETIQAEQKIQELQKKKETLATEIKELYEGSLLDKRELDKLNKEMPMYEEEAKSGEEKEKAVHEEWTNMMDLISSISADLKFD